MLSSTMNDLTENRVTEAVGGVLGENASRGANVVLALSLHPSDTGGTSTELCTYGTAIVIERAA